MISMHAIIRMIITVNLELICYLQSKRKHTEENNTKITPQKQQKTQAKTLPRQRNAQNSAAAEDLLPRLVLPTEAKGCCPARCAEPMWPFAPVGKATGVKGGAFCPGWAAPVGQPGHKPPNRGKRHVLH